MRPGEIARVCCEPKVQGFGDCPNPRSAYDGHCNYFYGLGNLILLTFGAEVVFRVRVEGVEGVLYPVVDKNVEHETETDFVFRRLQGLGLTKRAQHT